MELPIILQQALAAELRAMPSARLQQVAEALSERYRANHGRNPGPLLQGPLDALAYGAQRMPATFAAVCAALEAANARLSFVPQSMLDVGAGSGSAAWAALVVWPELARLTLLERDGAMLNLGRRLAARARGAALQGAHWQQQDVTRALALAPHDLVTASYILGELEPAARATLIDKLWAATSGLLVIVEPGTPLGFSFVREARDRLRAAGATIVAPCPHQGQCPMAGGDWCHFSQRLARSPLQRRAKGAELGYEDEKYAYVALARVAGTPIEARVIRHPRYAPGRVELQLCTPGGLEQRVVAKSERAAYRAARDAQWGEALAPFEPEQ